MFLNWLDFRKVKCCIYLAWVHYYRIWFSSNWMTKIWHRNLSKYYKRKTHKASSPYLKSYLGSLEDDLVVFATHTNKRSLSLDLQYIWGEEKENTDIYIRIQNTSKTIVIKKILKPTHHFPWALSFYFEETCQRGCRVFICFSLLSSWLSTEALFCWLP